MKLKRMWPAYCIWALFIIFDVVMVASSSFFLGLFPSDKKIMYTAVLTVLGILLMSVLMVFFGKLYAKIELTERQLPKTQRRNYCEHYRYFLFKSR